MEGLLSGHGLGLIICLSPPTRRHPGHNMQKQQPSLDGTPSGPHLDPITPTGSHAGRSHPQN